MKILTTIPSLSFEKHFYNQSNKRILFSGKFGSGKTYFLENFFKEKKKKINAFWLSPVKYSVSQNEDIFEYIKFDLAVKLISMPQFAPSLKKKYGEDLYLYAFLSNKPSMAIDTLLAVLEDKANGDSDEAMLIKAASTVKGIAQKLMSSFQKYKDFKAKIDKALETHSDLFTDYLKNSVLKKGSIFEDDLITQSIRSALQICKVESKKDNVLIIDDFDRLDPEHVFRILNILSVHNDGFYEENKFGFDKIIIVCDYDNIQEIYKHKYGSITNFSGYINKFFSTEVYKFNNNDAIKYFCEHELSDVVDNKMTQSILGMLLSYFVFKDVITIRDIIKVIIKHKFSPFVFGPYNIWKNPDGFKNYSEKRYRSNGFIKDGTNEFFISSDDYPFIEAIRILCVIFGNYSNFRKIIQDLDTNKDGGFPKKYIDQIAKELTALLHHADCYALDDIPRLCFSFQGDGHEYFLTIDYPSTQVFGSKITLPTEWKQDNPYDGSISYYKNVVLNMEKKNYTDANWTNLGSYKSLLSSLLKILDFLDSSGALQHIGVTKL